MRSRAFEGQQQLASRTSETMKQAKRHSQTDVETLREQLRVKEAMLQSARAALAQAETRLNGEIQQLAAELNHERHRRRKQEVELKHALAEPAAIDGDRAGSDLLHENRDASARHRGTSNGNDSNYDRRWRFSSGQKRRWKSL